MIYAALVYRVAARTLKKKEGKIYGATYQAVPAAAGLFLVCVARSATSFSPSSEFFFFFAT